MHHPQKITDHGEFRTSWNFSVSMTCACTMLFAFLIALNSQIIKRIVSLFVHDFMAKVLGSPWYLLSWLLNSIHGVLKHWLLTGKTGAISMAWQRSSPCLLSWWTFLCRAFLKWCYPKLAGWFWWGKSLLKKWWFGGTPILGPPPHVCYNSQLTLTERHHGFMTEVIGTFSPASHVEPRAIVACKMCNTCSAVPRSSGADGDRMEERRT